MTATLLPAALVVTIRTVPTRLATGIATVPAVATAMIAVTVRAAGILWTVGIQRTVSNVVTVGTARIVLIAKSIGIVLVLEG